MRGAAVRLNPDDSKMNGQPVEEHAVGVILQLLQHGVAVDHEIRSREKEWGNRRYITLIDAI